jgi:hypothetical protein
MYPNPATDVLYLDLNNVEQTTVQVEVYNLTGQLQMETRLAGAGIRTLDIASLSSGMYMVKVVAGNDVVTQQLVVE